MKSRDTAHQRSDSWIFFDDEDDHFEQSAFGYDQNTNNFSHHTANLHIESEKNFNSADLLGVLSAEERNVLPPVLNQMQQQLLPFVLGCDDSVVVSAPTGAGKTCILDMSILRSILVNNASTQIFYIAPSKALCRLQAMGFSKRFKALQLAVNVVTGDEGGLEEDDEGRGSANLSSYPVNLGVKDKKARHTLVVCTPEKLEAETRRLSDEQIALSPTHKVLLLVDEVHHIGERGRGAVLELVLSRILWAFRKKRNLLRFVCVSATIPNVSQIALWLNNAQHFEFTERPVPLSVQVIGYNKSDQRSDFLFEQDLDRFVPEVLRTYGIGKPALVFVSSRKGARDLAKKLREAGFGYQIPTTQPLVKTEDEALTECLRWGIGFHSAGLSSSDRSVVENLFRDGKLLVVCCTSTLAVGVDLPANLCIIRSTRAYRGPLLGFQDLERATLIQMIGRAGRPGYDTEGTAVIMTSREDVSKFLDLSKGLLAVETCFLANSFLEGLNAEIVRGRLKTFDDCAEWWHMTFVGQNLPWMGERLEALLSLGCIRETNGNLEPTATGKVASSHHLRLETVAQFAQVCLSSEQNEKENQKWDLEEVAKSICDGTEFADLAPRRDQKKFLNNVAWNLGRFKTPKSNRVQEAKDATFQLLQAVLGGVPLVDQNLRQNASFVIERAPRLCRALLKMLVDTHSNKALNCCLLSKCLKHKCWEFDQVSQLPGVGLKTKEKLDALGIRTLQDVCNKASSSGLPSKTISHAKMLLQEKRIPQVCFKDSALIIQLSECGTTRATTTTTGKYRKTSDWWLTCLGGEENKLQCWSENSDCVVISAKGLSRIMVFAIHKEAFGIDTRLILQVNPEQCTINLISQDCEFWEGFFLSSPPPSVKKSTKRMEKETVFEKIAAEPLNAKPASQKLTKSVSVQHPQSHKVQILSNATVQAASQRVGLPPCVTQNNEYDCTQKQPQIYPQQQHQEFLKVCQSSPFPANPLRSPPSKPSIPIQNFRPPSNAVNAGKFEDTFFL